MAGKVELALDLKALLGEGPAWDERAEVLYFVDILGKAVHRYDPATGDDVVIPTGRLVGAVVPRLKGGLVAALDDGFYAIDVDGSGAPEPIARVPEARREIRFNDGKCDAAGRFWAGTMSISEEEPLGALYCLDTDGRAHLMLRDITISNGLAWSSDNRTFYYIDTPTQKVVAYDFDLKTGAISHPEEVVRIEEGHPDGMSIDADGNLWIAHWGGYQVAKWNPQTGARLESIHVPSRHSSSCAFGGTNLDELYITSARTGVSEEDLRDYPASGGLFRVKVDVQGLPVARYAG